MDSAVGGCEDVRPVKVKGDAATKVLEYSGGGGVGEVDH